MVKLFQLKRYSDFFNILESELFSSLFSPNTQLRGEFIIKHKSRINILVASTHLLGPPNELLLLELTKKVNCNYLHIVNQIESQ